MSEIKGNAQLKELLRKAEPFFVAEEPKGLCDIYFPPEKEAEAKKLFDLMKDKNSHTLARFNDNWCGVVSMSFHSEDIENNIEPLRLELDKSGVNIHIEEDMFEIKNWERLGTMVQEQYQEHKNQIKK